MSRRSQRAATCNFTGLQTTHAVSYQQTIADLISVRIEEFLSEIRADGLQRSLKLDRPITVGEAWSDSRSMDYNLSGAEIILSADKKKNSGILAPACQFKINKEHHLELELLQNE